MRILRNASLNIDLSQFFGTQGGSTSVSGIDKSDFNTALIIYFQTNKILIHKIFLSAE